MKTYFTKTNIILILALIISLIILFSGNCHQVLKPVIIPVKDQQKTVEKKEAEIKPQIDTTSKIVDKLKAENNVLKKSIHFYQSKNKRLGGLAVLVDTLYRDKPVNDLVANNAIADSLCNESISNLETQVSDQAKVISLKDSMYLQLRQSFNSAMDQQKLWGNYSRKLEKKVKWTQVGKWAWKAGAIVGGLFILNSAIK